MVMNIDKLSVRPIEYRDIDQIAEYWLSATSDALHQMGADIAKIPGRSHWIEMLTEQLATPIEQKKSYCIIWEMDGVPVGHCNVNNIIFGKEAYMHLHLWKADLRKQGSGTALVKQTLPFFFENLKIRKLFCEPYAHNPAPNKTLEKLGFQLVKEYITIPGILNFEQPVKLWELSYEHFSRLR
jgi:RimJ/RimL family protein N-acetyltransferase